VEVGSRFLVVYLVFLFLRWGLFVGGVEWFG
jgi:hypothetical protein